MKSHHVKLREIICRPISLQVKSVKPCLKQLQQCIQTISTLHDDEILPSNPADLFHWLPKEHMCVLVYLVRTFLFVWNWKFKNTSSLCNPSFPLFSFLSVLSFSYFVVLLSILPRGYWACLEASLTLPYMSLFSLNLAEWPEGLSRNVKPMWPGWVELLLSPLTSLLFLVFNVVL